jgi:zinc/manganese transport system substrate-binding protein
MGALLSGLLLLVFAFPCYAKPIPVVTTMTELAWAAEQIGGAHVAARSLLEGTENPHYVDAVPEYIRLVADAQAVILVGMDLEIGWMPKVLARSGNAQVQVGGKGYCEAGKGVDVLEKPTGDVNRSMGDVHPGGNPHFWLSPKALGQAAGPITDTLIAVDPAHSADYLKGRDAFRKKLDEIAEKNQAKLKAVASGVAAWVIEYHKEFSYFFNQYGLKSFGSIEEKPGVLPSAGRLAQVGLSAKQAGVKVVLAGEYAPKKTLERFTEISGIPVAQLPTSIQPGGKIRDYAELQALLVDTLVKHASGKTP